MKYDIKILFFTFLLAVNTNVFADDIQAIRINLTDTQSSVDVSAVKKIQQIVGGATANGIVETFLVYKPDSKLKNRFNACLEASSSVSKKQVSNLLRSLSAVNVHASGTYKVTPDNRCDEDDWLVCTANPLSCFSQEFIANGNFGLYVAKKQFQIGLAYISSGKAAMEMQLNQWQDVYEPSMIGLQYSGHNCLSITVTGSASDGTATIACTLSGTFATLDRVITLTRAWDTKTSNFKWTCSTDADTKYAGDCKN